MPKMNYSKANFNIYREEIKIAEGRLKQERKKMDNSHKGLKAEFKVIIDRANTIYNYDDETQDSAARK